MQIETCFSRLLVRVMAVALLSLSACQVRQEVRLVALAHDPNKPVNPAQIPADSPAHLCSAEARLYLQFDGLAHWRQARADDPMVAHLWDAIAEVRPKGMWDAAAKTLGMEEDALTDRYFGTSLAIVGENSGTSTAYAILSRVLPTDLQALPMAMNLKPVMRDMSQVGKPPVRTERLHDYTPFEMFTSAEGDLLFATHDQWLFVGPAKHRDHFNSTVAFAASRTRELMSLMSDEARLIVLPAHASLVEDDDFQQQVIKLPRERMLTFYTRDKNRKSRHAAAVVMDGSQLVAHYAGKIDRIDELYEQFEHGDHIDFGFIPQSTISAASVNLVKKDAKGISALNLFVFPHNIEDHVLPKLASPMIVFLGKVGGDKIQPNPGIDVPALGMAIRMKDTSVFNDLNRIVGGIRFMANVSELDIVGGVFGGKTVKSEGLQYRIADFGDALVKQIKDPESARMFKLPDAAGLTKLTYGQIGDWFVLCTQESLYKECAAAHDDVSKRFTSTATFDSFPFEMRDGLMISSLTRAPELAALTKQIKEYWERMEAKANPKPIAQAQPDAAKLEAEATADDEDVATDPRPQTEAQKIRQPMEWIANAIKHRDSFYLQVWRDADGDLRGYMSTVTNDSVNPKQTSSK